MKEPRSAPPVRTRWTESQACAVLDAWETSGLSLEAFARKRGLDRQRLVRWQKKLERSAPTTLVPVIATGPAAIRVGGCGLVVEAAGVRVEVYDRDPATAEWTASLLRLLECPS